MLDFNRIVLSQYQAALGMLSACIDACPPDHWNDPIASYPFWHVAYHTLCYVDCYLAPTNDAWRPHPDFHPRGRAELEDEFPSRRFEKRELQAYARFCREKLDATIPAETPDTLAGPSGFSFQPFTRAELHIYALRHVQHHAGQLAAVLRRAGVDPGRWIKHGPPARSA